MSAEEPIRTDRIAADEDLLNRTNAGSEEAELLADLRRFGGRP